MAIIGGTLTYKTELDTSGVKKAGSTVKSIIAGLGITKLISKAMSTITSSVDDAIKRVDTLNNFPKVMSNLGISAEKSSKAINKMSDKLSGLPTTLDQGAMAVQRFTSKNGDVEKSTDIFLALNNAILAGGASSEIQATALEQISQAYAKGKPDMMEWRSMLTAMPAQLNQVADAMGLGKNGADELGEGLRKGYISMDEFMATIVKLNQKGTKGFQSFEQQAKNSTGGIATSITVAKTQIVKGVANILEGLNKGLKEANLPSIGEIVSIIGERTKKSLDTIAKNLPKVIKTLKQVYEWVVKNKIAIGALVTPIIVFVATFKTIKTVISIINAVKNAMILLKAVMLANWITLVIAGIVALVSAFIYLWNTSEDFRNFWINLWEGIKETLSNVVNAIVGFFTETIPNGINTAIEFFVNIGESIKTFFTKTIPQFVSDGINAIITFFKELPNKLAYWFGYAVGTAFQFGVELTHWIVTEMPKIIGKIVEFFKQLPGKIWNFFVDIINKANSWGSTLVRKGILIGTNFVNGVINFFKQLPGKIWNILTDSFNKVKKWGSDLIENAKKIAKDVFDAIVDTLGKIPEKVAQIGKDIIDGLWNGIKGAKDALVEGVKGLGGSIVDGFKSALRIGSPSRVMRDEVGQWIPKGLAVGIDMNADSVKNSLNDMYEEMNKTIKIENAKLNFDVMSNNAYNKSLQLPAIIDLSANFEGTVPVELNLDGEKIYDNQQKISLRKSIQYGGVQ